MDHGPRPTALKPEAKIRQRYNVLELVKKTVNSPTWDSNPQPQDCYLRELEVQRAKPLRQPGSLCNWLAGMLLNSTYADLLSVRQHHQGCTYPIQIQAPELFRAQK